METKRLILIDDNPDFGGHQVMTAYGLEGLLTYGDWEVLALLHPENHSNVERLRAIADKVGSGRMQVGESPTRSTRFQAIRRNFQSHALGQLVEKVMSFAPAMVLVIQGNIEQGSSVFRLKGQVKCPVVSYIPVPHKHSEMGAKLGALRDLTCRQLYSEPDGFITISETLAGMLKTYGASGRIQIVENGIPLDRYENPLAQSEARARLGLPAEGVIWGQIGRVEFKQKGQDFSLETFRTRSADHPDESLAFLGSGPDSAKLEAGVAQCERAFYLPWSDNPAPFLSAINGLLLPSRYEGVPLVMLEALANGLPVVATDRDGMVDWLPAKWRFAYQDQSGFQRAMTAAKSTDPTIISELRKKVWESHSARDFQLEFNAALEEWL